MRDIWTSGAFLFSKLRVIQSSTRVDKAFKQAKIIFPGDLLLEMEPYILATERDRKLDTFPRDEEFHKVLNKRGPTLNKISSLVGRFRDIFLLRKPFF